MNRDLLEKVVNAVLYEGYILYPYRASSKKNRQRFTFGRVYPRAFNVSQGGREPCLMQTQCLVQNESRDAAIHVEVRFLHPMAREIGRLNSPVSELRPNEDPAHELVPELRVNGKTYQAWHEAVERSVELPVFSLGQTKTQTHDFHFPTSRQLEPIRDGAGEIVAVFIRRQEELHGRVEITVEPVDEIVSRLTIQIQNESAVPEAELDDQDRIVMRTFASAHTIIWAEGGRCLSLLDPPGAYETATKAC
ncbi:MAG: hypothetical protein ACR2NX_09110, partial [Chthoniobacterales bacterium]